MSDVAVILTQEERDFLACVLYCGIGGDPNGPRKIGEKIVDKLHPYDLRRFRAKVEEVSRYGSFCIPRCATVVREA